MKNEVHKTKNCTSAEFVGKEATEFEKVLTPSGQTIFRDFTYRSLKQLNEFIIVDSMEN